MRTTNKKRQETPFPASLDATTPIGIFDSGVGGTTVLREIHQLLPHEPLLYLADQARCPYGLRDQATLRQFALDDTHWLLEQGAKMIVVACNTASADALRWLRQQLPNVPFVGMVPAVKPAALATCTGVVGVLATPATMQGQLLREVMAQWTEGITVIEQVAPGLVEHIEAGEIEEPPTINLLTHYLQPILNANADMLVLGCTHYPYLIPLIQKLAPHLTIVDAAPAIARQVKRLLERYNLNHPTNNRSQIHYTTTGTLALFESFLTRFELPLGKVTCAEGHPAIEGS